MPQSLGGGGELLGPWLPAGRLTAVRRAQDAAADGWRILEDYRIFLTSRSQEATAATEAVRNRWRNEARHTRSALLGF